ncbi:DUF4157 domain-containing protein [Nocardioides sp. YIM 152588]|uniref:eCIS core domain-containing protein n=1 Tax=Nocardioides sp. YIM 152588 TaxID=3158259 RepID=UPI0032E44FCA
MTQPSTQPSTHPSPRRSIVGQERREPLPSIQRDKMERLLGADLSAVHIAESRLPLDHGTIAVAQGEQIRFAPGAVEGWSLEAERVLAHELTHVLQHRSGGAEARPGEFEAQAIRAERAPGPIGAGPAEARLPVPAVPRGYRVGTLAQLGLQVTDQARAAPLAQVAHYGRFTWAVPPGGPLPPGADPTTARFRLSDSGGLLIEDCDLLTRQPKVFYATRKAFDRANAALRKRNLLVRLVYIDPVPVLSTATGTTYSRVAGALLPEPGATDQSTSAGLMLSVPADCRALVHRCGLVHQASGGVLSVLAARHGLRPLDATWDRAEYTRLARLHAGGRLRTERLLWKAKFDHYADPAVGEEYYSGSVYGYGAPGASNPANADVLFDLSGPGVVRQLPKFRFRQPYECRATWGDHVALVVARDGADAMTIQAYGRSHEGQGGDDNSLSFFQMYGIPDRRITPAHPTYPQTWHAQWTATLVPTGQPPTEAPVGDDGTPVQAVEPRQHDRVLVNHSTMVLSRGSKGS